MNSGFELAMGPFVWIAVVALCCIAATFAIQNILRSRRDRRLNSRIFELVAEHSNDGLVVQRMDATILWCNDGYCRMTGRTKEFWIGRKPQKWVIPPEDCPSNEEIEAFRYDFSEEWWNSLILRRNMRADGTYFWNQHSVAPVDGGNETLVVLVCRDVTEQVAREEALETAKLNLEDSVNYDALTGLANRRMLGAFLRDALADAAATERQVGLIHVDLDKFKEANDTHGHAAGDAILVAVAEILRAAIRDTDLAARVGGDEFILVLPKLTSPEDLTDLALHILSEVEAPLDWEGIRLSYGASLGLAMSDPGQLSGEALIQRADFALYEVKAQGRGTYQLYDGALRKRHQSEKGMSVDLNQTIENNGLDFHFQPILDAVTRQIVGVETLVRWQHPTAGLLRPQEFIGMAEDIGLLQDLDFTAVDATLGAYQHLRNRGFGDVYVSMNASVQTLGNAAFATHLLWAADRVSVPHEKIVVEILENALIGRTGVDGDLAAGIEALNQEGIATQLDDFGIGYAGLSHLARMRVRGIKIDPSLVRTILTERTSDLIVRAVLNLSSELDLSVVAEGVEDAAVAQRLIDYGCHRIQGYALAAPMPLDDLLHWMDRFDATALLGADPVQRQTG